MADPLPPHDRFAIHDLVGAFFAVLDGGGGAVAAMFTDDAVLDMGIAGRAPVYGAGAIGEVFATPRPGRTSRHCWSALVATAAAPDRATARFQVIVYGRSEGEPARAGHVCDTDLDLARDPASGGWQFASMRRSVVFAL